MAAMLDGEALVAELLERLCSSPEALQRLHDALAELEPSSGQDAWMDSKAAAAYLGMKPNALHQLTTAHAIPSEQHVPGGKRWFKRSDLDAWRRGAFVSRLFPSAPA
jgi:Helix-turn-helix domain